MNYIKVISPTYVLKCHFLYVSEVIIRKWNTNRLKGLKKNQKKVGIRIFEITRNFFPHSSEHSSKPFNWFKHTWLKSFYMIGSFWNLCRACPSMPVDKVIIITFMFIYIFMIAHYTFHYTTNFGPTLLNSYSRQKLNTHTHTHKKLPEYVD